VASVTPLDGIPTTRRDAAPHMLTARAQRTDAALDVLFGGDSGAAAGDVEVEPGTEPTAPPEGGEPTTAPTPSDEIQALLNQAAQAVENKQAALAEGDWAAYGVADAQLAEIIAQLIELTQAEQPATAQ